MYCDCRHPDRSRANRSYCTGCRQTIRRIRCTICHQPVGKTVHLHEKKRVCSACKGQKVREALR